MTVRVPTSIATIRQNQADAIQKGGRHIGDVIGYDATGIRVARKDLYAIFASRGFDKAAADSLDPGTALSRAAAKPLPKGIFAKAFEKKRDDAAHAIGLYVQVPVEGERGDKMLIGARVRAEKTSGRIVALPPEDGVAVPECLEAAERVASSAIDLLTFADGSDVTAAVVHVVTEKFRGVAMRRRGGIYFVRPDFSDAWRSLAEALAHHGFVDLSYPMVALAGDQRAMKSAAHMVKASLEGELADLKKELAELDDKTRDTTIERRVADCEALVSKAELYGEILGGWVDELRQAATRAKEQFRTKTAAEADDLFAPLGEEEP